MNNQIRIPIEIGTDCWSQKMRKNYEHINAISHRLTEAFSSKYLLYRAQELWPYLLEDVQNTLEPYILENKLSYCDPAVSLDFEIKYDVTLPPWQLQLLFVKNSIVFSEKASGKMNTWEIY